MVAKDGQDDQKECDGIQEYQVLNVSSSVSVDRRKECPLYIVGCRKMQGIICENKAELNHLMTMTDLLE